MAKRVHPYWIKERHNPQLGVYFVAMGQMSKTTAMRSEGALYGHNYMHCYQTQEAYTARIAELKKLGMLVQ